MDVEGNPLPAGFTGELWIGGNGVARGYFGNPEMTAERFANWNGMRWYKSGDVARWTDNGEIVTLGRNDGQIKLRGLHIELGEIENAISAGRDLLAEELREILLRSLTKYMVPTAYLQMDRPPMTPNGKMDRKALPDAQLMQRREYEPPRNEAEQMVSALSRYAFVPCGMELPTANGRHTSGRSRMRRCKDFYVPIKSF